MPVRRGRDRKPGASPRCSRRPGTVNTGFNAIHLNNGIVGTDSFTSCVDVRLNSISGGGKGTTPPNNNDLRLRQRQSTTVRLPGYGGAAFDSTAVATFEAGQNTVSTSNASTGAGGGFTGGSACAQPLA
ncbi:MAG TPA: hypothetical protein VFV02_08235 [Acidimicrobiales bacterium]|nr:hypothetical protein [Acidimicrobiales bacterium]